MQQAVALIFAPPQGPQGAPEGPKGPPEDPKGPQLEPTNKRNRPLRLFLFPSLRAPGVFQRALKDPQKTPKDHN